MTSLIKKLTHTPEGMRLYLQERSILGVTELISQLMQEHRVTKAELARRLEKSKAFVTHLLNGRRNMTVRTISDVMWALDSSLVTSAEPLTVGHEDVEVCTWAPLGFLGEYRTISAFDLSLYAANLGTAAEYRRESRRVVERRAQSIVSESPESPVTLVG